MFEYKLKLKIKPILDDDAFAQRVKEVAEGVPLDEVSKILSKLPPTIQV